MRSLGAEYSKAGDDGKAGAAASRGLTPRGERRLRPERRGECEAHRRAERPQCEIAIAPHRRPAAHRERKQERKGLVLERRRDLTNGGKSGEPYGRRLVAPQAANSQPPSRPLSYSTNVPPGSVNCSAAGCRGILVADRSDDGADRNLFRISVDDYSRVGKASLLKWLPTGQGGNTGERNFVPPPWKWVD